MKAHELQTALVGCLLAWWITLAASGQFEAGLPIAGSGLALGVTFAVAVGVFAGIFPALSASRMTPIDALRS